eukprot:2061796-Amphidinium_carterae.1
MVSLDIDEPQVLLRFADDPVEWHHRVLIRRLRDAVWVVLTPDGELQVENLADYQLLALERGQPVPALAAGNCYLFEDNGAADLPRQHRAARRMAVILGGVQEGDMQQSEATWRVADPAAAEFGTEVSVEVVNNPATCVTRGAVSLAMTGLPARWLAIKRVAPGDVQSWLEDKHAGAGRDSRLCGPVARGKFTSSVSIKEVLQTSRPQNLEAVPAWPFAGPRAVTELLQAVHNLGLSMFTYHSFWSRQSGVHADSAVAWEHKMLCTELGLLVGYDRLDPANIAGIELMGRRLVMIERAL